MAFSSKAPHSLKNDQPTHEFTNEAYDPFPGDDEAAFCDSENDESATESTDDDDTYQNISLPSKDSGLGDVKPRRKSTKSFRTTKTWDVFRETSADNKTTSDIELWNKIFTTTKVIFCIILFIFVIGTAIVSKSTLFLVLANIIPPNSMRNSSLKTANYHFRFSVTETDITWIWALVLIVIAPYVLALFFSVWRLMFKRTRRLLFKPLLVALLVETVHSIGLNMFIFAVLPNVDPVTGALMCTNVAVVPSVLSLIFAGIDEQNYESTKLRILHRSTKLVSLVCSLLAVAVWTYHIYNLESEHTRDAPGILVLVLVAPLLVSITWWENFVPQGDKNSFGFQKIKRQLRSRRTKVSAIINFWKIVMTIGIVSIVYGVDCRDGSTCIDTLYDVSRNATLWSKTFGQTNLVTELNVGTCTSSLPLLIAAVNIVASGVCYRACVAACKIVAQSVSFAAPLVLATPVTLALIIGIYAEEDIKMTDGCYLPFPRWHGDLEFEWSMILPGILGYIAVVLITSFVWSQSSERMQREENLFVQPLYCGVLLDQSMLLNRRKHVSEDMKGVDETEKVAELHLPETVADWTPGDDWSPLRQDDTPYIYLCATMWHETENEMTQILKSLFRMDEDQCARRNLQLFFNIRDPDYYEFEAHIFFDDAYESNGGETNANGYVKQLIYTIDVALSSVYSFGMQLPPPTKVDTPYGGRLIWMLPGGNKLTAHLKDKSKIRHRKRWSQVMYMYYFLGHKLLSMGGSKDRLRTIADNTFLLALDGDVDFQPSALRLLVDRMRRKPNVGAACGRIHPIGSGPMVWYQKFEYAVSHWLQKATEHTIGCVLCSPGCFSLFRGSSIMDDNVMRRYTTPPTEARHYVQYDQGEDRWLCTLLLQQGYRVEYCAASDALTYAPEGFYEFYNQRRRWTPSTMANIIDLLMDWKNVTKKNNDISMLYITYHIVLMVSSILTPGTIFLLIIGAISMAYPELPIYSSLILNLIPVGIFVVLVYTAKSEVQLAYAAVLSTIYSLVMMLVVVGLLRQAAQNGFCSVTTVFLCGVAGIFVVSALLHPQEFWCIIHGGLYFLAIPSMSMLLLLYSLGNLHVVSWGTRETPKPAVQQKPGEVTPPAQKKSSVHDWLEKLGIMDKIGSSDYVFSFGNLFRCICCPKETKEADDIKLHAILDRLDDLESKIVDPSCDQTVNMQIMADNAPDSHVHFSETSDLFEGTQQRDNPLFQEEKHQPKHWLNDPDLKDGDVDTLKVEESLFWDELIDTYLYPLVADKQQQEKTQEELLELRNTVCLFFILVNALFITIVFSLQQISESDNSISIELPCASGNYGESIEPISIAFTAVFGILLVIQFICMIFHRMSTFLHICAITEVNVWKPRRMKETDEEMTVGKGLVLVMDMQGIKDDDTKSMTSVDTGISISSDDTRESVASDMPDRKHPMDKLRVRRKEQRMCGTLSENFARNFSKIHKYMHEEEDGDTSIAETKAEGVRARPTSLSSIPEDEKATDLERIKTIRKTFRNLDKRSILTISNMKRNTKLKQSIMQRGEVANKWKAAAARVRLRQLAQDGATGTDAPDGRPASKVGFASRLAVAAERDIHVHVEEDDKQHKF